MEGSLSMLLENEASVVIVVFKLSNLLVLGKERNAHSAMRTPSVMGSAQIAVQSNNL